MTHSLTTTTHLTSYLTLPKEVQKEIELWEKYLRSVTKPVGESLKAIAARMGVSVQTARRKYDAWRVSHDWRALVNRAKLPEARGLDKDFIEYWKQLCQENGRKCAPAYRKFVRAFKNGEPIPGIEPGVFRGTLPVGYSYDNLIRYRPTDLELIAARIGRSATAPFRPLVFTKRTGLRVGQYFVFDDMWHDFKVQAVGQNRKPGRLLQLHAHDLLSGCQFLRGLKMRMEDAETGKSVGLKLDEMVFLVAQVVSTIGFHPDGTQLLVEHGTAAIPEWLEKLLYDLSGGKIIVVRSGIEGASAFAGQYAGRGKGNFRFKASLESLGNLIHNETADMVEFPGQTGSNSRLNCPEELHGREKHMDALALAMVALPAQVREKLKLPLLEVNQAKWMVHEVMERINQRTEHELDDWLECGFTATDFELDGLIIPQHKYLALAPEKRTAIDLVAAPITRKLSPREVFDAGRRDLVRFRPEQTALLLRDTQGIEASVGDDHLITFERDDLSSMPLRFKAHHFRPGDKFRVVPMPWDLSHAHLFAADGSWVGTVEEWQRHGRDDVDAVKAQMGRAEKTLNEILAPVRARGAAMTRQRLEATQHNISTLKGVNAAEAAEAERANRALMEGMQ